MEWPVITHTSKLSFLLRLGWKRFSPRCLWKIWFVSGPQKISRKLVSNHIFNRCFVLTTYECHQAKSCFEYVYPKFIEMIIHSWLFKKPCIFAWLKCHVMLGDVRYSQRWGWSPVQGFFYAAGFVSFYMVREGLRYRHRHRCAMMYCMFVCVIHVLRNLKFQLFPALILKLDPTVYIVADYICHTSHRSMLLSKVSLIISRHL